MPRPSVAPQIAAQIIEYIREHQLAAGDRLPAQALADQLRVSRAPVTAALKQLEVMNIVRSEPNRGFCVAIGSNDEGLKRLQLDDKTAEVEDEVYFQIADDRLSGRLSDRVSESELMRLYALSRLRLHKVLHRIAEEGWIERLPGNGWEFKTALTSRGSYEEGYRFRAAIEAEALALPTFKIDAAAFVAARNEQKAILNGGYKQMSRDHLFRSNSGFHEMLIGCSGNMFFVDSLRRVNGLRRLIEYRITVDRSRLPLQCREHLQILDLVESGQMPEAAQFLRRHILGASAIKSPHIT